MGGGGSSLKQHVKSFLFSYETPKVIEIESRFIGVFYKILQLVLFSLVIVWVFILNNGYQYIDNGAIGGTTNKIKGVAYSNSTDQRVGRRIWDSADLHVPPQDDGAFFLTTNVILTKNQTQGECPSLKGTWTANCTTDDDCLPIGKPFHLGHGVSTGKCDLETEMCIVEAWCPIEDDNYEEGEKEAQLQHTADFTVLIKNHVYFPHYNKTRSNFIEMINKTYLRGCRYHPVDAPYCPIFRVGDVVSLAETKGLSDDDDNIQLDDKHFYDMAVKGGVVSISVKWDCNFDYSESDCKPLYEFKRLDNYQGNSFSSGYNFRYPFNYFEDGVHKRTLIKAYGILFLLKTEATARAFDLTTFLLNIGSGLALLGIAEVLSEIALLHLHRNRKLFQKIKSDHQPRAKKMQGRNGFDRPNQVYNVVESSERDKERSDSNNEVDDNSLESMDQKELDSSDANQKGFA